MNRRAFLLSVPAVAVAVTYISSPRVAFDEGALVNMRTGEPMTLNVDEVGRRRWYVQPIKPRVTHAQQKRRSRHAKVKC